MRKVRAYFYQLFPNWEWLQWTVSLLLGVNFKGQRMKAKQPYLCLIICLILIIIGIKYSKFFTVKGLKGVWMLKSQFSNWFWLKIFILGVLLSL